MNEYLYSPLLGVEKTTVSNEWLPWTYEDKSAKCIWIGLFYPVPEYAYLNKLLVRQLDNTPMTWNSIEQCGKEPAENGIGFFVPDCIPSDQWETYEQKIAWRWRWRIKQLKTFVVSCQCDMCPNTDGMEIFSLVQCEMNSEASLLFSRYFPVYDCQSLNPSELRVCYDCVSAWIDLDNEGRKKRYHAVMNIMESCKLSDIGFYYEESTKEEPLLHRQGSDRSSVSGNLYSRQKRKELSPIVEEMAKWVRYQGFGA